MPTNEEIEALAMRLDYCKIRFARESEAQAAIRRNVAIDDAAAMLRQWIAEREWKDIRTAPMDGTWVQLRGGSIDYGWDGKTQPPYVIAQFMNAELPEKEAWMFAWYDGGFYGEYCSPTHWRPAPKEA